MCFLHIRCSRLFVFFFPIAYFIFQRAGAFSQPGPLVRFSEMSDRNRTCQSGRATLHHDVQPGSTTRRGDVAMSGHTVKKFQMLAVLQLNIEGLTASKMNVLHHLAVQNQQCRWRVPCCLGKPERPCPSPRPKECDQLSFWPLEHWHQP